MMISYQELVRTFPNSDLSWFHWNGSKFIEHEYHKPSLTNCIEYHEITTEIPETLGSEELLLSKTDQIKSWWLNIDNINLADNSDALICLDYIGDIAQLYVDDILVADDFYKGTKWLVSLRHIKRFGNNVKLIISKKTEDNIYIESEERTGLDLKDIHLDVIYDHKFKI